MVLNDREIFKKLSVVLEAEFALIQSTYLFYSHVQKLLHKSLSIGLYFSKPCETASAAIKLKFTFFFVKRIGHDRVFFFFFIANVRLFFLLMPKKSCPLTVCLADSLIEIQSQQSHPESRGCAVRDTLPKIKQWPHWNSNWRNFVILFKC